MLESKKDKIIMVVDNHMVSDSRVEKEISSLINFFSFEVIVLAIQIEKLPQIEIKNGYEIHRILNPILKNPLRKGYNKCLHLTVSKILKYDFNILHCHDYHMLFIGCEIKKIRHSIKLIYDSHEYLKGWPLYLNNKGLINKIKGYFVWKHELKLEKKAIKYTDQILTVSKSISRALKTNNNLKHTPIVLRNFPEKIDLKKNKTIHRIKKIDENKKIIVHSGSIYFTDSQLFNLIKILDEFNEIVLIFIGNRDRFYEIKKIYNLKNNIFFINYPNDYKSLFKLLSAADIGLMHVRNKWNAHKMGSANRYIQYSHAGLAIISSPQKSAQEINSNYNHTYFYEENDFKQFKSALESTLKNISTLQKNAENTRDQLNWKNESKILINLYNNLILNKNE